MNADEASVIVDVCLRAVREQYVMPLTLALGTLTAVACRDPAQAQVMSAVLQQQAESCPDDAHGKWILQLLAEQAARPAPVDPAAVVAELRTLLHSRGA